MTKKLYKCDSCGYVTEARRPNIGERVKVESSFKKEVV